jgi:anti-sigma regulatory factor (Ser/Thr protein kinase)
VGELERFAGSEPQHDDITVLAVRRVTKSGSDPNPAGGLVFSLRGADSSVRQLRDAVSTYCRREAIPKRIERHLKVVVDELISNVLLHATPRDGQELQVDLELDLSVGGLMLRFSDNGAPFNPLEAQPPDTSLDLENRPIGGLGLHLVRQLANQLNYRRESGRNVVEVELSL